MQSLEQINTYFAEVGAVPISTDVELWPEFALRLIEDPELGLMRNSGDPAMKQLQQFYQLWCGGTRPNRKEVNGVFDNLNVGLPYPKQVATLNAAYELAASIHNPQMRGGCVKRVATAHAITEIGDFPRAEYEKHLKWQHSILKQLAVTHRVGKVSTIDL